MSEGTVNYRGNYCDTLGSEDDSSIFNLTNNYFEKIERLSRFRNILHVIQDYGLICPCRISEELGISLKRSKNIYPDLCEILARNWAKLTPSSIKDEESKKLLIEIKGIEKMCENYLDSNNLENIISHAKLWFKFFKRLGKSRNKVSSIQLGLTSYGKVVYRNLKEELLYFD